MITKSFSIITSFFLIILIGLAVTFIWSPNLISGEEFRKYCVNIGLTYALIISASVIFKKLSSTQKREEQITEQKDGEE
jgi:hypothetical protein